MDLPYCGGTEGCAVQKPAPVVVSRANTGRGVREVGLLQSDSALPSLDFRVSINKRQPAGSIVVVGRHVDPSAIPLRIEEGTLQKMARDTKRSAQSDRRKPQRIGTRSSTLEPADGLHRHAHAFHHLLPCRRLGHPADRCGVSVGSRTGSAWKVHGVHLCGEGQRCGLSPDGAACLSWSCT